MEQHSDRSRVEQSSRLPDRLRKAYSRIPRQSRRGLAIATVMAGALAAYVYWTVASSEPIVPQNPDVPDALAGPRVVVVQEDEATGAAGDDQGDQAAAVPDELLWPVQGSLLAAYGWVNDQTMQDWRFHRGIDVGAPAGEPVIAAAGGIIKAAELDGSWGWTVVVEHAPGFETRYSNLGSVAVSGGAKVMAGDVIGTVGESARIEAGMEPHVHFELLRAGEAADPLTLLPSGS